MMKRLIVVLAVLALPWVAQASPYTCDASGCSFNATLTTPTTLTNGKPITDLTSCTISWTKAVDGGAAVAQAPVVVPTTKPGGGETLVKTVGDPADTANHTYAVQATATCTSTAFGTSAPSPLSNLLQMNNGVAPNPSVAPVLQ